MTYIGSLIPVQLVEYEHMGNYSAWHQAIFVISSALSSALVPFMLNSVGGITTLFVCGISMLMSSIGYYIYIEKKHIPQKHI